MLRKNKKLAILLAVVQSLLFVLMGVWARFMNESFTVSQQVFWRMIIALIIAWLVFGRTFNKKIITSLTRKDWLIYLIRSLLYFGAGVMLITFSVNHTTLAIVSFASSLPFMGFFGWLMFKERLDHRAVPFILLSVIGLGFLCKIDLFNIHLSAGLIAAFLSIFAFDISYLMVRYHRGKMTNFQNTTLLLCFAWIVPFIAILLGKDGFFPDHLTFDAIIGLLLSAVFNILNLYLLNYIFTNLKGYVAGNILLLEGVFALAIGAVFYSETVGVFQILGALLILLAAYAISYFERDEKQSINN